MDLISGRRCNTSVGPTRLPTCSRPHKCYIKHRKFSAGPNGLKSGCFYFSSSSYLMGFCVGVRFLIRESTSFE